MNDHSNWQESNAQYLTTVLARLRARLDLHAGKKWSALSEAEPGVQAKPKSSWRLFGGRSRIGSTEEAQYLELEEHYSASGKKAALVAQNLLAVDGAMVHPPALVLLGQLLGLSRFEQEILLLCAAMELDAGFADLCARAFGAPAHPYPTFALALTVLDEPTWDALSPERPLRYWRLVEINQPGAQPLTTSPLRADERIVNYLKGLNYLDDRLAPLLTPLEIPENAKSLSSSQQIFVEKIVDYLKQSAVTGQVLPVVQLLGPDSPSKRQIAGQTAKALGLAAYRLAADLLPVQATELENLARLWRRESQLLPLCLYLDAHDLETSGVPGIQAGMISRMLDRTQGVVFLDSRDTWQDLDKNSLQVDVVKPTPAEQQASWALALGQSAGQSPALLAGQFNLGIPSIKQIAAGVLSEPETEGSSLHERLWDVCLADTRPRLESLAVRIEPKASWNDIVLPARESGLLRQIADQVGQRTTVYDNWGFRGKMSRGLGINALFAGPSGAGKTMAAEVLANALRLNLYRIDLSAVVSKYIGETEKNLRRLFDAAEDGGAILFFDEADALFGKRSEVKDSHDRYANIEINYLLQRMEAFQGLAILATNMKSALDDAFTRRLRFIVNFTYPGVEERKAIWQKIFPAQTPTIELDFDRLARLQLTGGEIRNIALNSAFLAARAHSHVTMALVLESAREEFRKLDKPINEADFRWPTLTGVVA